MDGTLSSVFSNHWNIQRRFVSPVVEELFEPDSLFHNLGSDTFVGEEFQQ